MALGSIQKCRLKPKAVAGWGAWLGNNGCAALLPKADMCSATRDVRYGPKADIARRHSMRKGPPFGSPQTPLFFFSLSRRGWCRRGWWLLIAPILTSITPIRAGNAHGLAWITNAGLGIRCGHNRNWHCNAERSRRAQKHKSPKRRLSAPRRSYGDPAGRCCQCGLIRAQIIRGPRWRGTGGGLHPKACVVSCASQGRVGPHAA
jgi:hypothetical protein